MESKEKNKNLKKIVVSLPTSTGVYLMSDASGQVIYVGKARNIRQRLQTHLLVPSNSFKEQKLKDQTTCVHFEETNSEFNALLREAQLIQQYNPKYNAIAKDDKSPIYIYIPLHKEFPIIMLIRKRNIPKTSRTKFGTDRVFGPFSSSHIARKILLDIRHIIPYCQMKRFTGKPCFYTQLHLCNPCPSYLSSYDPTTNEYQTDRLLYRNNIRRIVSILDGSSTTVLNELTKEMNTFAKQNLFEKAGEIKRIQDAYIRLYSQPFLHDFTNSHMFPGHDPETYIHDLYKTLLHYIPSLTSLERIECVDISTIAGQFATGSLVILSHGIPDPGEYRRFKIKEHAKSDMYMMEEVIKRRIRHKEWPKPDLLVLDGGKPQLTVIQSLLRTEKISWPIIGIAKRYDDLIIPLDRGFKTLSLPKGSGALSIIQVLRDEAHRFAKTYHTKLRGYQFLPH
jgi:excinuclease ABC subunit C